METPPFSELGLPDSLLAAVESLGFERPSPIQALSIPPALEGRDLIGLSQTGSGKTAAFTLPMLAKLDLDRFEPQALVLCPTRELANQVCEDIHRLGSKVATLRAVPVYGGAPIDRQLRALRQGAHVVVGTPGRVLDHLRRGSLQPGAIRMVVLDEADRMLDMGFRDEMEDLLADLPDDRQTLFFSATMNRAVSQLIERFGREPQTIKIEQKAKTVSSIDQCCYEVRQRSKVEVLSRLLDIEPSRLSIVFCNTKRSVDEATEALLARGYAVDRLHGDITQQMRERVLKRFRDRTIDVLVATDVAARGLDIDEIDLVINYDLPQDPEDYVHRIGRTGRAGRSGRAVSFVFGRDLHRLETIERYTRQPVRRERVPSQEQVEGRMADRLFEQLKERLGEGKFESYADQLDRLLEQGFTPTDVVSALISMLRDESGRDFNEIQEDHEEPGQRRGRQQRERREPRERGPKREHSTGPVDNSNMTPLFLSLGKQHGVKVGEIIGMLYNESGIPQGSIGHVKLFFKHSRVDVDAKVADQLIGAMKSVKYRNKPFVLDHDKGPR
ncbi:RNA helicase [Haloferula helveola]|uniref:RNA helicase n=1 Tax=Haloferula helveola TaxID=490095 RepID=A0ABM7REL6_9BACT|nr:RNA helicase [Haloferula helveola]